MRPDHTLQTGFLAALYAFSKESYGQQEIRTVVFSDIKLHFKVDQEKDIIVVFTTQLEESDKKVEQQLDVTLESFMDLYEDYLGRGYTEVEVFDGFNDVLYHLNVVKILPMGKMNLREKVHGWKKLFRRYVHE